MADETKSLQALIFSIIVIAILLIIGIYINTLLQTTVDADDTVVTVNSESGFINNSGYQLLGQTGNLTNAASWTIVTAVNVSTYDIIPTANYTVSGTGLVTNETGQVATFDDVVFNYTYRASVQTPASLAAADGSTALSNGTPWLTILVVVGFAMIVLAYLMGGFRNAGTPSGSVY